MASDGTPRKSSPPKGGRRLGLATEGAQDEFSKFDPRSIMFSAKIQATREPLVAAQHAYTAEHRAARGAWAPPSGKRLGISASDAEERKLGVKSTKRRAKGYHEHFEELQAELIHLVKGGSVYTKDRVEREASALAEKGDEILEEEVDSVISKLRKEVGESVEASEVDEWGVIYFPSDIPEAELRKRQFPYKGGAKSLRTHAQTLSLESDMLLDSHVDTILHELRDVVEGKPLGAGPGLSGADTIESVSADAALLKDWVGRFKPKPPPVISETARVQAIREARRQAEWHQEAWRRKNAEAIIERAQPALIGRDRPVPTDFPSWAFKFFTRSKQDLLNSCDPVPPDGYDCFVYPYPDPPVPNPAAIRQWPSQGRPRTG